MQKYTRPFISRYPIGSLNKVTPNQQDRFFMLSITPGDPMGTYIGSDVQPKGFLDGYNPQVGQSTNILTFGITSNNNGSLAIGTVVDASKIADPLSSTIAKTFTYSVPFGSTLTLYVAVICPTDFLFTSSYDVSNLALVTPTTTISGLLVSGSVLGILGVKEYKIFKFSLTAKQVYDISLAFSSYFEFRSGTGVLQDFSGVTILSAGFDPTTNKSMTVLATTSSGATSFTPSPVANISITSVAGISSMLWRKLLPDTSTLTVTTGTAPATSSSLSLGAVALNASVITNLDFFNSSPDTYNINSVAVTLQTPSLTLLTAAVKGLVATDFTVTFYNADGTSVIVPAFSATTLTTTLTLNLTIPFNLTPLTSVRVTVTYNPKTKVASTLTLTTALANAINAGRKVKVQLMGNLSNVAAGTAAVAIGDPLFVNGAV